MKIKRYVAIILTMAILFVQVIPVSAGETSKTEWYEMVEEEFDVGEEYTTSAVPYTQYLVDVMTTLAKQSSSKVGIRADVYCSTVVKSISIKFYLQKLSGGNWVTVATGNASVSGVSSTGRSVTVSGLSSGTYRAKAKATVTDKYGYSESLTSITGSLSI
ncbi:MAG: hypothetical protein EOM40_11040 [Clostridia bacterium]|nr:hypothetical protein [Clostridia bacterium]NCC43149.1 hypothetical protein [Clostridia bacterium]